MLHSLYLRLKNTKLWQEHLKGTKFGNVIRKTRQKLKPSYGSVPNYKLTKILGTDNAQPVENSQVDVIVPIYNGYDFLVKLFSDITKTSVPCRYILVDDCSPDERIKGLLDFFAAEHENTIIIRQKENGGFVKSVNAGLKVSKGNVALINTDTELPEGWLERLMYPIEIDDKVATTTPYTNSGTICSFPNIGENNKIYKGLSIDEIDAYFKRIMPRYTTLPTGVGFCMGMSRKAIEKVGLLDEEHFGRGYGEENDWCLRAVKEGFINVQVENLFVYHKHGGSFVSEEKEKLIREHLDYINKTYPRYSINVANFMEEDKNADIRKYVQMCIDSHNSKSVLFFDHCLGGGATEYFKKKKRELLQQGACVGVVRYNFEENYYTLYFENDFESERRFSQWHNPEVAFDFDAFEELFYIIEYVHYDEIHVNELVTYPNLFDIHEKILDLKERTKAKLVMLFHDYFALCPSITFLNEDLKYCGLPESDICDSCFKAKGYVEAYGCGNVREWRVDWQRFLAECDEVRCFSQDTLNRVKSILDSDAIKYTLVPHSVNYMYNINKSSKTTKSLNIGVLGAMSKHKGSDVLCGLMDYVEKNNLDIRFKLIGFFDGEEVVGHSSLDITGKYRFGEVPRLIYENDVDIFLVSAIWPETFSYTTEEIIKMGMPVACFNLGAPVERVSRYERGHVIESKEYGEIVEELRSFAANVYPKEYFEVTDEKKVAFYTERVSYASRYREEHFAEEMLFGGCGVELWTPKSIKGRIDWNKYKALVVYRSRFLGEARKIMSQAKENGVPIIYDIDDLVFDYDIVKTIDSIDKEEYNESVCNSLKEAMSMADGITTSTDTLADIIKSSFPNKPVFVNRNQASAEMTILSTLALNRKYPRKDKFVLGYFSGSFTHNKDFAQIEDTLIDFILCHSDVYLSVAGNIELSGKLQRIQDRIITIPYVDWRQLPEVIASVDVNLMPLEDSLFHRCKSEIKWLEAAMVSVPTVASFNKEIAGVTRTADNIVLCKSTEEWMDSLERLYIDEVFRNGIAENARQHVMNNRTTVSNVRDLQRFVDDVVSVVKE